MVGRGDFGLVILGKNFLACGTAPQAGEARWVGGRTLRERGRSDEGGWVVGCETELRPQGPRMQTKRDDPGAQLRELFAHARAARAVTKSTYM